MHVNGKEVSGVSECNPRKGYLALESEGAECRFKNIKIKELPSTNPKPNEIADEAKGHTLIYNGLDFDGLTVAKDTAWKAKAGSLQFTGKDAKDTLATTKKFKNAELIFDWQTPAKGQETMLTVAFGGENGAKINLTADKYSGSVGSLTFVSTLGIKAAGNWNRAKISKGPEKVTVIVNGIESYSSTDHRKFVDATGGKIIFSATGPFSIMHPYILELK